MNVAELTGESLDYWMYEHACHVLNKAASRDDFQQGYSQGLFQFSTDKALLADLVETYQINIQRLAGEWLASSGGSSFYGENPLQAACRLVIALTFGKTVN